MTVTSKVDLNAPDSDKELTAMLMPQLRDIANALGVRVTTKMKKTDLIEAIKNFDSTSKNDLKSSKDEKTINHEPQENSPKSIKNETKSAADRIRSKKKASKKKVNSDEQKNNSENKELETSNIKELDNDINEDNPNKTSEKNNQKDKEEIVNLKSRRNRKNQKDKRKDRNSENENTLSEDDEVEKIQGVLDVLDNYAFIRTSGYVPGPNDIYVSMNFVRKNGLRKGDAIVGLVKVPKENENQNQRQKFNSLVKIVTINGKTLEEIKNRSDFNKLTPLYPNERLRLETDPNILTTRVIDLVMPIGKGQRALIVSPPKAGKTSVLQSIANAIAKNNPECYLMVILVDERPEEVTDMQRSVKGEVISSTFDRPPSEHTSVAELAIERAKRLVEEGNDVVVLLDSITRLGRAYNNSLPASGRILSGGVDSAALYPPKRFLGAARNIEFGGSLTIIATAMVETGSMGDNVIFEEFKGTGNAELKLDRKIAERRVFPAVDVNPSGTRRDDLLLNNEEAQIIHKLRRILSGLDSQQAIDLIITQLKKTKNNFEFLLQIQKNTPDTENRVENS